jgi:hypothetical protein
MSIFEKGQSFSRKELSDVFRKDSGAIPKTGGKKFYEGQRKKMPQETFGKVYGSEISKQDYRHAVQKLNASKREAKTFHERSKIAQRVSYLKRMGGIK